MYSGHRMGATIYKKKHFELGHFPFVCMFMKHEKFLDRVLFFHAVPNNSGDLTYKVVNVQYESINELYDELDTITIEHYLFEIVQTMRYTELARTLRDEVLSYVQEYVKEKYPELVI